MFVTPAISTYELRWPLGPRRKSMDNDAVTT